MAQPDVPRLEGYKRPTLVGRGAFGMVYKAVDERSGQLVAIKVLHKECAPPVLKRFRREANTLAQLKSPNLIRLLDMKLEATPPFYVMEWVPAGTLATQKPPKTPADPAKARQVARELLSGIGALHAVGLIHRDIKPQNVLVRADGTVVLGDLGLVGEEHASTISETGSVLGTPRYMPPEVLIGKRWAPAGDLFAAGITLWEYAVGQHLAARFGSQPTVFLNPDLKLPGLEEAGGYANPGLERLIHALLRFEPGERPASAAAAVELLGAEAGALSGDAAAKARWVPGRHAADEEVTDQFSQAMTQAKPGITGSAVADGRAPGGEGAATRPDGAKRRPPAPGGDPTRRAGGPPRSMAAAGAASVGMLLLVGAGAWLLRPAPGPGALVEGPTGVATAAAAGPKRFPEGWQPAPPRVTYLPGGQVELAWTVPAKAHARGTRTDASGIQELPRSRAGMEPALRFPAPAAGAAPPVFGFQLVDGEGTAVEARLDPTRPLAPLGGAIEALLTAAAGGEPAPQVEARFLPMAGLFASGALGAELGGVEPRLYRALALIEGESSRTREAVRARLGQRVLDDLPAGPAGPLALPAGELPPGRAPGADLHLGLRLGPEGERVAVDLGLGGLVVRIREAEAAVVELSVPAGWIPPDQLEYTVTALPGSRPVEEMRVLP